MKKLKNFSKKYLIGFFIGLILFTVIGVSAATYFPSNQTTYNNAATGMSATNVQTAIDELYNVCKPKTGGDAILDNVDIVTSGDGLYKDEYEDGKYTYKGANPNNYVTFNNETAGWRIVSINSDRTIKIMKTANINTGNSIAWDTSNSNNWNRPASLNTYLNSTYYNGLNSTAQNQIVTAKYYAGAVKNNNNDMSEQINDEKSRTSNVKIALPTLSEYIRAGSNTSCKTFSTYQSNYSTCGDSNWIVDSNIGWTLTPYSTYTIFLVNPGGDVSNYSGANNGYYAIHPIVTLSSKIKITGGNGSQSNPYTIK